MIKNGAVTYAYDAGNRLIGTAGMAYIYDGDGRRVEKCTGSSAQVGTCATNATGTLYWMGTGSHPLVETDLSGNVIENYIFFGGERIARRDASTKAVHFYFSDTLGTHSLITDSNGDMPPQEESDYYPYGGEIPITTGDSNHYKFTGKERDTESGLDNFGARYDASSLGRFMTPDWAANPTTVPYAHFGNPQSLNLYTYVNNNPTTFTDPDGHCVSALISQCNSDPSVEVAEDYGSDGNVAAQAATNKQDNTPVQEPQRQAQNTQSLAAQVPSAAKAAIANALNASNSPTADDKKGGFHEESVKWGTDASGNVIVSPSVPGAYAPPGTNPTTNFTPANPQTDQNLATVDGFAHIHPKGGGDRSFVQGPSAADLKFAGQSSAINLVVGAADKKVYFFNGSGVIGSPMKLKDFMGGSQ
jgi:RHS repeat-associated protein